MNLNALRDHRFPLQRVTYTDRDTILYALSVGVGADPLDANQLRLAYEKNLASLPTMAAVLAHPGMWVAEPQFEVNYLKLLHGEQNLTVHAPLPPQGELDASYRVVAVVDKGAEKGALAYFEKELRNAANGELLCTVSSTLFLRADGGAGSFGTPPPALPTGEPGKVDFTDEIATKIDSALLYRLNGDRNPIHVDPAAAAKAGFTRPILHGLCTYGAVGYMLVRTVCGHDPARLRSLGVRFSSPVYPGETIRIEGSRTAEGVYFNATVPARQQPVLTSGFARIG
jgi:acyl dehydratase